MQSSHERPAMNTRRQFPRAFTLIELLVVIAIIALLIAMLLPALSKAREAGRNVVCASMVRQLCMAQLGYANDWKEFYASRYTSGAECDATGGAAIVGDTTSTTPTSSLDWISPSMGEAASLSPGRAKRTIQIFNNWRCPSATLFNATTYGTAPDSAEFEAEFMASGARQVSYLQPFGFATFGSGSDSQIPFSIREYRRRDGTVYVRPTGSNGINQFSNPVQVKPDFVPNLAKVGTQPSSKVAVMDGTRYYDEARRVLDFDINPAPTYYSSFCDTPSFVNSRAFGRTIDPGTQNNVKASFRHQMNANLGYFDGHASSQSAATIWRRVDWFYPSGSIFNGIDAPPESRRSSSNADGFPVNQPLP
jgi:prepilin-type N-terminal cleavage/methylation domain-containing protein/prepilin-type processing-associated H-X9-DG protein